MNSVIPWREIGQRAHFLNTARPLQEQEFERLGGTRTHHVDIRLLAATNRDLADMVKRSEFRSDLYYRLNVFPILIPPLRTRGEDIPALVTHKTSFSEGRPDVVMVLGNGPCSHSCICSRSRHSAGGTNRPGDAKHTGHSR